MKTEQEKFWEGEFGDEYNKRNDLTPGLLATQLNLFSKILSKTRGIQSVIEFGANIGINLRAIKSLLPQVEMAAVEINREAADKLNELDDVKVYPISILDYERMLKRDFVFTRGVLIHINPDRLKEVYQKMYDSSNKYICIIEYYNPRPVAIEYRGEKDRLFKRDFCGEMMREYPDLKLVDYGFCYHNDPNFPQDDVNWFLLEK